jgi:hypothetical protein
VAIPKQAFYEGAALHLMVQDDGSAVHIRNEAPFFVLNERMVVYLKYCTKVRSPWGFTFLSTELEALERRSTQGGLVIGLICGADGVAAVPYESFLAIASPRKIALHVACYRRHGEHYEVKGPDGVADRKVPPSNWRNLLNG